MARSGRLRRPGRGPKSEDQSNPKTGLGTTLVGGRFRLIVDDQGTFNPRACAPPRRTLDDAVSPSTIRLKRASTITEIRNVAGPYVRNGNVTRHGFGLLHGGTRFACFGLSFLLALKLARVGATVQHHAKAVCFGSGAFNAPGSNIANSAPDGLAFQLGFKDVRLRAGHRHAHAQAGCFGVAQEGLNFASRAGQPVDCPAVSSQACAKSSASSFFGLAIACPFSM